MVRKGRGGIEKNVKSKTILVHSGLCCLQFTWFSMTADGHNFIHPLLPSSTQSMQMKRNSPPHLPTENDAKCNAVGKSHCFRMMVWLCAYYDFYDKKVYTNVIVSSYHISAHTPVALHRSLPSCCAI